MAHVLQARMRGFIFFFVPCFLWALIAFGIWAAVANAQVIEGTPAGDYLEGTRYQDTIRGLGGPDQIYGKGSKDFLEGNGGEDVIKGGGGDDIILGGTGDDLLFSWGGTSGIDSVVCGDGHDTAYVGPLDSVSWTCELVQVVEP